MLAEKADAMWAMIPGTVRRSFGLKESGLTNAQTAALGTLCIVPGGFAVAMTAVGTALLIDSVRNHGSGNELWSRLEHRCLQKAHLLLKQKSGCF